MESGRVLHLVSGSYTEIHWGRRILLTCLHCLLWFGVFGLTRIQECSKTCSLLSSNYRVERFLSRSSKGAFLLQHLTGCLQLTFQWRWNTLFLLILFSISCFLLCRWINLHCENVLVLLNSYTFINNKRWRRVGYGGEGIMQPSNDTEYVKIKRTIDTIVPSPFCLSSLNS